MKLIDKLDNGVISWESFSAEVKSLHKNRIGAPYPRVAGASHKQEETFYANPFPGCICDKSEAADQNKNRKVDPTRLRR